MNEIKLLNNALNISDCSSIADAYAYLIDNLKYFKVKSSQFYNYLYCFAALLGKKEEALVWIEEAIISNGLWYRPAVFEDSDLEILFDDEKFLYYKSISDKRYADTLKKTKTLCTWHSIEAPSILIALHGNQQNISICRENWDFMNNHNYQVEYIQSPEIDSTGLFRWSDNGDGALQLYSEINKLPWRKYTKRTLGGFSAGCNVILEAITHLDVLCEQIILVSPWIPYVISNTEKILEKLLNNKIKVLFVCGLMDNDCIQFRFFAEAAKSAGIDITTKWIEDMGHEFPPQFESLIEVYINPWLLPISNH